MMVSSTTMKSSLMTKQTYTPNALIERQAVRELVLQAIQGHLPCSVHETMGEALMNSIEALPAVEHD